MRIGDLFLKQDRLFMLSGAAALYDAQAAQIRAGEWDHLSAPKELAVTLAHFESSSAALKLEAAQ